MGAVSHSAQLCLSFERVHHFGVSFRMLGAITLVRVCVSVTVDFAFSPEILMLIFSHSKHFGRFTSILFCQLWPISAKLANLVQEFC